MTNHNCNFCNFQTNNRNTLDEHQRTVHLLCYKCARCDYRTDNRDQMREHYHLHLKSEFGCRLCGYMTSDQRAMDIHRKFHSWNRCPFCNFFCPNQEGLTKHVSLQHRDKIIDAEVVK